MKICLYSDNHFSQYSSIVRKRGEKYSLRLENQIDSLNWVMQLAYENSCMCTICCGDLFDKAELNSEEISALNEIKWAPMTNYFIAGNHEMGSVDHKYSTSKLFNLLDTGEVFTKPTQFRLNDLEICILPYILESERKPLSEYFEKDKFRDRFGLVIPRLIISHNDIQGIQMGKFISQNGFSIDEIESNCDLCINGHLHNGSKISKKIINIGNLTGQNFSEDAYTYDHVALILDTDTMKVAVYENPYALNFYKIDLCHDSNYNISNIIDEKFKNIKNNAVITIKCNEEDTAFIKDYIKDFNIIESRLIINYTSSHSDENIVEDSFSIDHLNEFREYMIEELGGGEILLSELDEVTN